MKYFVCLALFVLSFEVSSQNKKALVYDSLDGFDINLVYSQARAIGILSEDVEGYVSQHKRKFIFEKYNLAATNTGYQQEDLGKIAVSYCLNEDFENSFASTTFTLPSIDTIKTSSGINGWVAASGFNSGVNSSCSMTACCTNAPTKVYIIGTAPGGYTDALIGAGYPIFSVFGDSLNSGASVNPFTCKGNYFVKLSNDIAFGGANRITKTINVTSSTSLFRFAAMAIVDQGGHCCCDYGGFSLKIKDCLGNPISSAPVFSITPSCSSTLCITMPSPITFSSNAAGKSYTKWSKASINLSPYIGNCITIEASGFGCVFAGHHGYAYFDAQCDSMYLISNSNIISASSSTILINSCSSVMDTLIAPDGLSPYLWTGPIGFSTATTQSIVTNIPGTYTLSMSGFGPNPPSFKYITISHAPLNIPVSSSNSIICQGDSAILSASGVASYTWSTGANTSSIIVTPSVTTTYSVNGTGEKGCPATATFMQSVSICTGLNTTTEYLSHFLISPNPNPGEFIISAKNWDNKTEARIYNTLGQLILTKKPSETLTAVAIKSQPSGIYIIKLFKQDKLLFVTKIIKENS